MQYHRHKANGFTLIELLICISIISILAGILLPGFAGARSKAQSITCKRNLKQLGFALFMYAYDYGERFPIMFWDGTAWQPAASGWWGGEIKPYVQTQLIFICPSHAGSICNYIYNGYFDRRRVKDIREPCERIILADSSRDGYWAVDAKRFVYPTNYPLGRNPADRVGHIHFDHANYLFADGHVKAIHASLVRPSLWNPNWKP
ncbi:MAG TPA: DUF1559 domain-containing protein [Armatimonadetes bacterium]|nr:DUF1559 domain-containing protein [Armatimonadota bacterium]